MRSQVRIDFVSLASGALIAVLGVMVLLDESGELDISLGWMAVLLTGAVGALLLISGLVNGGEARHD
jgi:hypothetical protein